MPVNPRQAYDKYLGFGPDTVPDWWKRDHGSAPEDLHYYHAMNNYRRTALWDDVFKPRDADQQFQLDAAL